MEYIISGIIGLIGGAIGSLVAPWVNWKIEIKKELLRTKKELILKLRTYLQNNSPKNNFFLNSIDYISIRPYLSNNFVNELEDFETTIIHSYHRGYFTAKFIEELDTIEDLWQLSIHAKGITKKSYQMQKGIKITVSQGKKSGNNKPNNS